MNDSPSIIHIYISSVINITELHALFWVHAGICMDFLCVNEFSFFSRRVCPSGTVVFHSPVLCHWDCSHCTGCPSGLVLI